MPSPTRACPNCNTSVLISFSIEIRNDLAADSIMIRDGVGVDIGDRSRERGLPAVRLAGLAGARLRPTLKRTGVCALEQMTVPGEQF